VGCASRLVEGGHVLGCLVVSNYGARRDLHMLTGVPAADAAGPSGEGGSIMIVLATDAPLSERQLRRLGARAALGLGRAGSFASNGSGEFALAFSTAQRLPHRSESPELELRFLRDDSAALRELFEAAGEVTAESVLNSLCMADAMQGRDGHRIEALPYEMLEAAPALRRA
jgi:D-aminopeptidase